MKTIKAINWFLGYLILFTVAFWFIFEVGYAYGEEARERKWNQIVIANPKIIEAE